MSQGHAHLWLVFGLLLASPILCAQKHRVEFTSEGDQPAKWLHAETVGSVEQVPSALTAMMARLYARGYLEASIDTCLREGTMSVCQVQFGTLYRWARLSGSGIAPEIASEARFREKLYGGRPITPVQVARLFEDLLHRAENNGHPFARVWLDSLRQDRDGVSATLRMEMGRTVLMDSVVVRGTAKTNLRYLESHIGIRPGDPYNEALIRNVERRVRELPFVT
jgi:translocation and assembly module TamA